jgi:pimeloyl-ACP methyl ester carboxylesterase
MVFGAEKYLLYVPQRKLDATPALEGLAYEDVWFPARDGVKLHGWFIPAPGAKFTLLWFHGNAGNISHRVRNIGQLHRLVGAHVLIFDYRGYGQSEGGFSDLSEPATYHDGTGAVSYLRGRRDVEQTRLVYFGRSLGAAIAVEMARHHPPAGMILETTFTSIPDMARLVVPYIPVRPFLRIRYDTVSKLPEIHVPVLIVHGDQDEVMPLEQAQRLLEAANPPKDLYTIAGARHNDTHIVGGDRYFAELAAFLARL